MVAQGELWLMETPNRKRRPVLVVSRDEVIPVVNNVVVAPVTRAELRLVVNAGSVLEGDVPSFHVSGLA